MGNQAKWLLYWHGDPYDLQGTEAMFLQAMKENFFYHVSRNPAYMRMVKRASAYGFPSFAGRESLGQGPPIPTLLFKRERFWTAQERRMAVKATSSGTSGKQSQIGYDWESVFFGALMAISMGRRHRLFSPVPANYLMLGYEPHPGNETMVTKTQRISSLFAPPRSRTYALRCHRGKYRLDDKGLTEGLKRYSREPFPVRIVGFPSYLYFLLRALKAMDKKYVLPLGSLVLLGGGWKNFYRQQVDKGELYGLLEERLGILPGQVNEFFGVAEHPGLYCSCPNRHFHVPVYSRVLIRDPRGLKPLGYGAAGILNLLSPLAKGMPLLSVMTDDIAVLHEGKECGCGIESPYFEVLGRAGLNGVITCVSGGPGRA